MNIYATICVRLAHSGIFANKEMWRNAAVYTAAVGGECGLWLREMEDGKAEVTLFFDHQASEETRFQFEDYVHTHLQRRALPDTIQRRRIFVCQQCDTPVSDLAAQRRRQRGPDWIACNVCDARISLLDREERLVAARASVVPEMDHAADTARDRAAAASILHGKIETRDYDVFLSYHSKDRAQVEAIAERLKEQGILPWLDQWDIPPFTDWIDALDKAIRTIGVAAICCGAGALGPWQKMEIKGLLNRAARRRQKLRLGMVILPGCRRRPRVPVFLEAFQSVDFRKQDPDPMEQLIWGITGERPANMR